jgi:hypothetical protein
MCAFSTMYDTVSMGGVFFFCGGQVEGTKNSGRV